MNTILLVSGNKIKIDIAQNTLKNLPIELITQGLETPEIQSTEVEEIALFSASWAAKELNNMVIVTDAGYYIEGLNGFPGPFIKYVNQWFTTQNFLDLMKNTSNRKVVVKETLAFCKPHEKPISFTNIVSGVISHEPRGKGNSPIDELFIPDGFSEPLSQLTHEEMVAFWVKQSAHWKQLEAYLETELIKES